MCTSLDGVYTPDQTFVHYLSIVTVGVPVVISTSWELSEHLRVIKLSGVDEKEDLKVKDVM